MSLLDTPGDASAMVARGEVAAYLRMSGTKPQNIWDHAAGIAIVPEAAAALATLDDLPYYRADFRKIIAAREDLSLALTKLGFQVFPSQTNFIFTRPPRFPAKAWLQKLRDRKVLVRWFADPAVKDYLRITIGTREEIGALVKAAEAILKARA